MANILINAAHNSAGATAIAFSPDGKTIYTGGGDCIARIWNVSEGKDVEADVANEADEPLTSITATENSWITASADSNIRLYNNKKNEFESLLLGGNAIPMRCVAVDPQGERVAITSDDLDIKVVDLNDTTKLQTLTGHKNGVRKATWHPSSSYLTTCGQDGRIGVWDMSQEKAALVKMIEGIIPFEDPESDGFANDCSAVWHPNGKHFYVATRAHEIATVSRDTWSKNGVIPSLNEISSAITALAISPNGMYLASASKEGILIWSTQIKQVLFRYQIDSQTQVCQLAFSPAQNLLVWGDTEGKLYRWVDPIPSTHPAPASEKTTKDARREKTPLFGQEEDEYGEDVDDDWIIDDVGGTGGILAEGSKEKEKSYAREIVSVTKAQLAFQPGATPMKDRKGYLAYNNFGVIEVTDQDSHQIINVEFHDRSTYNSYHFTDYNHFTLASMGDRGIVYARPSEKSDPSQICYKPYSTWGSSAEWQLSLPAGEEVIAIAAGGMPTRKSYKNRQADEGELEGTGNVVIATNAGYLRFFSGSGIQRYVWAMGGDIVSMVAGNEWVFVVHREGGTSLDGRQNLRYTLISLDRFVSVQGGELPLPKGKTLRWIGISEEGAPAMYDSNGVLFLLDRFRRPGQARWVPVLDTNTLARRVGKDESYWPVGVSEKMFMCVILKGRAEYPGFPRPIVQELELQIPLVPIEQVQVMAAEERLMRESIVLGWMQDALGLELTSDEISSRELEMDKEMMKLLQGAVKEHQLQRAHDIVRLLNNANSLDTAYKLAEYYHLIGLQEKIKAWKAWREESDDPREEVDLRNSWARGIEPVAPPNELVGHLLGKSTFGGRPQEFRSAPVFQRRSLANAVPNYGHNAFARKSDNASSFARNFTQSQTGGLNDNPYPEPSTQEFESFDEAAAGLYTSSPPADGKRKREDDDEMDVDDISAATKKPRTSNQTTNNGDPSLPSSVPAAKVGRKAAIAVPTNAKPNPFARNLVPNRSIVKSNTFFEKVDAAESAALPKKGKGSEKKATKQTTLFGMAPRAPGDKKSKVTKHTDGASPPGIDGGADKIAGSIKSSVDVDAARLGEDEGETQQTEAEEETQPIDDDMEEQAPNAVGEDDEEPIEWPESPAREVSVS